MFVLFHLKPLLFLILMLLFNKFDCKCVQSYVTICESIEDMEKNNDAPNFIDIIVGNETITANPLKTYNLYSLIPFRRLLSLTVIGQLNRISPLFGRCEFVHQLQVLNFYKNEIKTLESDSFPNLKLKRVSLVNNNIENVEPGVLSPFGEIEIMDLSDNKVEVIEDEIFKYHQKPLVTKILTLRNNKISFIQAGSIPRTLQILNLDGNKLREIQDGVTDDLPELQEFTISRNHLYKVPKLSNSNKLKFLNISFNNIEAINNASFQNLKDIYFIDLSNNKLKELSFSYFTHLIRKGYPFLLSVGFNELLDIKFENITKIFDKSKYIVELFLYGNPFDCKRFDEIQVTMQNLRIKQNKCDAKFHSEGKTPYCLDYSKIFALYVPERVKAFLEQIANNRNLISCQLYPENTINSYPKCVA